MPKMLDMARLPGLCGGGCANGVTRPLAAVPSFPESRAGTRHATLNRSDAALGKRIEAGVLKAFRLYRQLVDLEIGRASEHGARWWSRRLVEVYEEAGLVGLAK